MNSHPVFSQMMNDIKSFPTASNNVLSELSKKKDMMVESVNYRMSQLPEIHTLIGHNPLQVMYDNHQSHIHFIIQILKLDDPEMLIEMIPWVYRTYHILGFDFNYFPIVFSLWEKVVSEYLEPATAQPLKLIYQLLNKWHPSVVKLVETNRDAGLSFNGDLQKDHELFLHYLIQGDYKNCISFAKAMVKNIDDLAHFYLQVIQPSLYRVGFLWQMGEISVAEEHLSTSIVSRVMAALYTQFPLAVHSRGKAVISSTPNEYHEIGGRIVADLLESKGWDVDFIGANTPQTELILHLKDQKPFLLGLSVTMPYHIQNANEIIKSVRGDQELRTLKIMVGGLAFLNHSQLWRKIGADGWAPHGLEAVHLANIWWGEAQSSNV